MNFDGGEKRLGELREPLIFTEMGSLGIAPSLYNRAKPWTRSLQKNMT
jgi:hypothetical protein